MPNTNETTPSTYQSEQAEQFAIEAATNQVEEPQEVENEYFVLGYN